MATLAGRLKAKLRQGQPVVGSWITMPSLEVVEVFADAGYDFLVLDMEHTVIEYRDVRLLAAAMESRDVPAIVRVPANDPAAIKRALDAGVGGIMVPQVNSEGEAKAAVRAVKYPPQGARGVGFARAQGYGFEFQEYLERANVETLVVLQVEHIDAVREIDAIASVSGVDVLFMGPADLSASMGLLGKVDDPAVQAEIARVRKAAQTAGVAVGFHCLDPEQVPDRLEEGYRFIAVGFDFRILGEVARKNLAIVRNAMVDGRKEP